MLSALWNTSLDTLYLTTGGGRIHQRFSFVFPGLYAVGQNGLGGMVLWGHGLHIAWALTSGRLVGPVLMKGEAPG